MVFVTVYFSYLSGTAWVGRYLRWTNAFLSFGMLSEISTTIQLYHLCQHKICKSQKEAEKLHLQWGRESKAMWSAVLKHFDVSSFHQVENRQRNLFGGYESNKSVSWFLCDVDICSYTYKWMWCVKKSESPRAPDT